MTITITHQFVGIPYKHRLHRDSWDKGTYSRDGVGKKYERTAMTHSHSMYKLYHTVNTKAVVSSVISILQPVCSVDQKYVKGNFRSYLVWKWWDMSDLYMFPLEISKPEGESIISKSYNHILSNFWDDKIQLPVCRASFWTTVPDIVCTLHYPTIVLKKHFHKIWDSKI